MIWSVMAWTNASASESGAGAALLFPLAVSGTAQVTPGRHSALSHSSHSLRPKRGSGMPRFCLILRRSWSWAFLQAEARVGDAQVLLNLEKVLELGGGHGLDRFAQLRSDQHGAAVGLKNLYLEVGVLYIVMAPRDHTMVGHEDGIVFIRQIGDKLAHLRRARRAIRRSRHGGEDLKLRDHAGGRLDTGDGERRAVGRMTVHRGDRARLALHDLEVH